MNDYEAYEEIFESNDRLDEKGPLFLPPAAEEPLISVDFEDPVIASLPRVLLMGPRRGGKTSIQVRKLTQLSFMYLLCVFNGRSCHLSCAAVVSSHVLFYLLRIFLRGWCFKKCLPTKPCFD